MFVMPKERYETMEELLADADKLRHGVTPNKVQIGDYSLCIRKSRPPHPIVVMGKETQADNKISVELEERWVRTLDIVQIGYTKWEEGECRVEEIPKNGAAFIFDAIGEYCDRNGLALRIESIMSDKWMKCLFEKRGFIPRRRLHDMNLPDFYKYQRDAVKIFPDTRVYQTFEDAKK